MIHRYLALATLLWLPSTLGQAQSRIGEWRHFAPIIDPRALSYHEGQIYAATAGGALIFDLKEESFTTLSIEQGLVYPDIRTLTISDGWLWLGGAEPRGVIQLVNLSTGAVDVVDLDIDVVTRIVVTTNRGFVAFRQGQEAGIIELRWDGRRFDFADSYQNFPISVGDILDLDLYGDSLFVTTRAGVLGNNFVLANLKDPFTWTIVSPPEQSDIIQYHVDSTGHYLLVPDTLFHQVDGTWDPRWTFVSAAMRHLTRSSEGNFIISMSNLILILQPGGTVKASQRAQEVVMAFVDVPELAGGVAALRKGGLAVYEPISRTWMQHIPNSMAGPSYTALLKLDLGELVAAGLGGITRFKGGAWYNIIPSFHLRLDPEVDRVHGDALVSGGDRFLADTLFFRGKQSWNMVQLPGGDLLVGFKGNPPAGGGVLRLNFNDVSQYEKYDTTGGQLDGLASDGFITIRHMARDSEGNVWIANTEGANMNSLAVLTAQDQWVHFSAGESGQALSKLPTEIVFDDANRVWVGNQQLSVNPASLGGIAVLDYGPSLEDKSDDQWRLLSAKLEAGDSNTIWSLAFDHNGILWTLSPQGVMGFEVEADLTLRPFINFGPLLSDIPFVEGAKIRVDAQNNKWISTPTEGFWVLLDNTTFWPSVEGFNSRNSPLPSDEILDIYLDDEEGVAYIATSKGISSLKMPFRQELADYTGMVIFPSPFRIPSDTPLVVDQVRQGSSVKVFTIGGRLVKELTAQAGDVEGYQAFWDGKNGSGEWVGSGVYLITAYLSSGRTGVGKVAVIRR